MGEKPMKAPNNPLTGDHIPGSVLTREQLIDMRSRLGFYDYDGVWHYGIPPSNPDQLEPVA